MAIPVVMSIEYYKRYKHFLSYMGYTKKDISYDDWYVMVNHCGYPVDCMG